MDCGDAWVDGPGIRIQSVSAISTATMTPMTTVKVLLVMIRFTTGPVPNFMPDPFPALLRPFAGLWTAILFTFEHKPHLFVQSDTTRTRKLNVKRF